MAKEKKSKSPRSSWVSKYFLYPEASNFHNKLRDILLNGQFKGLPCYQEVPLSSLVEDDGHLRVDWFIEPLNVCIELQGRQHYIETNFNNKSKIESSIDFIGIKYRDNYKKGRLQEAGYIYIAIPYTDETILNEEYLVARIKEAVNDRESK